VDAQLVADLKFLGQRVVGREFFRAHRQPQAIRGSGLAPQIFTICPATVPQVEARSIQ
jgi:hypothetical protein